MMSYAQGSSVGTTSTSVPECRKETPDRLAVCTVDRTVTHRLPLTGEPPEQRDHTNHKVHKGEEQNHMDRTTRTTATTGGRKESPTQHRCHNNTHNNLGLQKKGGGPYHGGRGWEG